MCPQMCPHKGTGDHAMKLNDAGLRNLTTPGKHFDGHGLYLEV